MDLIIESVLHNEKIKEELCISNLTCKDYIKACLDDFITHLVGDNYGH